MPTSRLPLWDDGRYAPALAEALPGRVVQIGGRLVLIRSARQDPNDRVFLLLDTVPAPEGRAREIVCRYCGAPIHTGGTRTPSSAWSALDDTPCDTRGPGHAPLL